MFRGSNTYLLQIRSGKANEVETLTILRFEFSLAAIIPQPRVFCRARYSLCFADNRALMRFSRRELIQKSSRVYRNSDALAKQTTVNFLTTKKGLERSSRPSINAVANELKKRIAVQIASRALPWSRRVAAASPNC